MPLEIQIGQVLDASFLPPNGPGGLETALNFVKKKSALMEADINCSLLPGCPERARKTILQLILIEWGVLGVGSSTAGLFLANHYQALGPYFGDVDGHNWPNEPLVKAPSPLESAFQNKMVKMTQLMSLGKLSNISLLDLPAFGSNIPWLKKHHKREPNWPTEMNFAIQQKSTNNMPEIFKSYKTMLTHWENYMMEFYRNNPLATFTPEMKVSPYLSFTNHIKDDFETFLVAIHGSFLSASSETLPIWTKVANDLFGTKNVLNRTSGKALYDNLIIQCGFKEDILKQKKEDHCQLFEPSLTTNGLCYSFNGETTSNTWKSTEVTDSMNKIFRKRNAVNVFERAGTNEGKIRNKLVINSPTFILEYFLSAKQNQAVSLGYSVDPCPRIK